MAPLIAISEAAKELGLDASRVRSMAANGDLPAEKIAGRWLVSRDAVLARRREPVAPGRPLTARNAWTMLLVASGEDLPPATDPMAAWRMRRSLAFPGLAAMRPRLKRRAQPLFRWAPTGELRATREDPRLVLSGPSAGRAVGVKLIAPDAIDAYVSAEGLDEILHGHALQDTPASAANVILRVVPTEAWVLDGRRFAPAAAVALDLASYPDSRSSSEGARLLARLSSTDRDP